MSQDDSGTRRSDGEHLPMKRRTFVGASVAVGGAVAAFGLLEGCSNDRSDEAKTSTVVRLRVNGEPREVTVDNRTSVLDMLREQVGLTGTKKGCDQGACGACTVMVNGQRVVSCLTLAVQADGAEITTIEGLEQGGRLHPLQQAFIDEDGFQCGVLHSRADHLRYRLHPRRPRRLTRGDPGVDATSHGRATCASYEIAWPRSRSGRRTEPSCPKICPRRTDYATRANRCRRSGGLNEMPS
jgi:xanthine dehydrogenase YagT iron-sulfur-binding subunit